MTTETNHIRVLTVSLKQLEKVDIFVKESGWGFPPEDAPAEKLETEIALVLSVLENFDYDPLKAAKAYRKAHKKAWAISEALHDQIMAQVPGENKIFYDQFSTYEEAKAFLKAAAEEAGSLYEKILTAEFHDKLHFHEAMTRH